MWQQKELTRRPQISALQVCGKRVYWIASDDRRRDDEAHHSKLYVAEFDGEPRAIADGLPASELLAISDEAAYLWDEDEHLILRADFDGNLEKYNALEGWLRGELVWSNGRLYFMGMLHAGGSGVAVFSAEDETWKVLLDVRDTTAGMRERTAMAHDHVWCLRHKREGWILESHDQDGNESEVSVALGSDFLPRHMVASEDVLFIATEKRILRAHKDGRIEVIVETELPAEDMVVLDGKPAWLQAEVDEAGEHEWRVRTLEDDQTIDVLRIADPIVELSAGEHSVACITRSFDGDESAVVAAVSDD